MPYEYEINSRLGEVLRDRGFTQKKVAEIAGVPEPTISRFSRQARYDIKTLFAIADALDVKIEELFTVKRKKGHSLN